jgi:hypothetical protein
MGARMTYTDMVVLAVLGIMAYLASCAVIFWREFWLELKRLREIRRIRRAARR